MIVMSLSALTITKHLNLTYNFKHCSMKRVYLTYNILYKQWTFKVKFSDMWKIFSSFMYNANLISIFVTKIDKYISLNKNRKSHHMRLQIDIFILNMFILQGDIHIHIGYLVLTTFNTNVNSLSVQWNLIISLACLRTKILFMVLIHHM